MIIDKKHSPEEFALYDDAPPSYDEVNPGESSQGKRHPVPDDEKGSTRPSFLRALGSCSSSSAVASSSRLAPTPTPTASHKFRKLGAASSFSAKASQKSQADVRATVLGLVRDLVQKSSAASTSADAARGILESCSNACAAHGLVFSRVLQERSIEGHAPLYWAIVKRPRAPGRQGGGSQGDENEKEEEDILFALLSYTAPLSPSSVSELRLACLVAADNALFQRLRASPSVIPLSGTDLMLLSGPQEGGPVGESDPLTERSTRRKKRSTFMDGAAVREGGAHGGSDAGAFSVRLELAMFQRRMRVTGEVAVEFVARGRLWRLCFFVVPALSTIPTSCSASSSSKRERRHTSLATQPATVPKSAISDAARAAVREQRYPPGTWAVCLSLLEHSPQCWADVRLVVDEPDPSLAPPREPPPITDAKSARDKPPPLPPRPAPSLYPSSSMPGGFSSQARNAFRVASLPFMDYVRPPQHPPVHASSRSNAKSKAWSKVPPIALRLACPGAGGGPLLAPPPPPDEHVENEVPGTGKMSRKEARAVDGRERREREGRETKRDRNERSRLADTVVIANLEEPGQTGRGGCLMYDGCSYIAADGTLRAVLEARLRSASAFTKTDTDCIIY
ncbi:hypothetical protein DFH11DRAFT_1621018 [Phellopilus nigrolimitatus]|nr:hypothetical protein DFH11DRAFT_1621018 [Phellopilus nigrolimitatus]